MKRLLIFSIIIISLLGVGSVVADKKSDTVDLQKQLIKIKCSNIKIQVNKVKLNDSLTRVNYGQMYESIITKLMIPVNTQLITNRFSDQTNLLVKISDQFEQKAEDFRSEYQVYQEQIDELARLDCQQDVDSYYQALKKTQDKRRQLKDLVVKLEKLCQAYQTKFKEIINEKK